MCEGRIRQPTARSSQSRRCPLPATDVASRHSSTGRASRRARSGRTARSTSSGTGSASGATEVPTRWWTWSWTLSVHGGACGHCVRRRRAVVAGCGSAPPRTGPSKAPRPDRPPPEVVPVRPRLVGLQFDGCSTWPPVTCFGEPRSSRADRWSGRAARRTCRPPDSRSAGAHTFERVPGGRSRKCPAQVLLVDHPTGPEYVSVGSNTVVVSSPGSSGPRQWLCGPALRVGATCAGGRPDRHRDDCRLAVAG